MLQCLRYFFFSQEISKGKSQHSHLLFSSLRKGLALSSSAAGQGARGTPGGKRAQLMDVLDSLPENFLSSSLKLYSCNYIQFYQRFVQVYLLLIHVILLDLSAKCDKIKLETFEKAIKRSPCVGTRRWAQRPEARSRAGALSYLTGFQKNIVSIGLFWSDSILMPAWEWIPETFETKLCALKKKKLCVVKVLQPRCPVLSCAFRGASYAHPQPQNLVRCSGKNMEKNKKPSKWKKTFFWSPRYFLTKHKPSKIFTFSRMPLMWPAKPLLKADFQAGHIEGTVIRGTLQKKAPSSFSSKLWQSRKLNVPRIMSLQRIWEARCLSNQSGVW